MKIKDYKPINWDIWKKKWDGRKGRGQNIKHLLSDRYWKIWDFALPNQDKRDDPGHGEVVTYFSHVLCNILNGNPDVVIPAAIFHDTGYEISGEDFRKAFLSVPKDEQEKREQGLVQKIIRFEHQIRDANNSYTYLRKIGWPIENIAEIQSIIADHDTRILKTTRNGQIMQDADILWRFTLAVMEEYYEGMKKKHGSLLAYMENDELAKPDRFNFPEARQIAKFELVNLLYKSEWKEDSLRNPKIRRHIEKNYPQELERVIGIYNI